MLQQLQHKPHYTLRGGTTYTRPTAKTSYSRYARRRSSTNAPRILLAPASNSSPKGEAPVFSIYSLGLAFGVGVFSESAGLILLVVTGFSQVPVKVTSSGFNLAAYLTFIGSSHS